MCQPKIEYASHKLVVPEELITPVPISDRRPATWADLATLATEHLNSAQKANAKILATRKIIKAQ